MKTKDFYLKLKKDGKINNPKFDAFIESISADTEMDDEVIQAFESAFFTLDRAATHKDVHSKLKREILDPIDNELKPITAFIDSIDRFKASEIDKIPSTYEKLKAIQGAIPELYEKVKKTPGTDDDLKKKLKTFEETNQDLLSRIEKMNNQFTEKEKYWEKEANEKIHAFQLRSELQNLANKYTFGKAFSDKTIREDITKVKLDGLLSRFPNMRLVDKDGKPEVVINDKEGKPLFKENSNTAITINQLLEDEFKPYIKVSNGDDDDTDTGGDTQNRDTNRFKVNDANNTTRRQGARTTVQ